MKKIVLVLMILFVLTGCGGEKGLYNKKHDNEMAFESLEYNDYKILFSSFSGYPYAIYDRKGNRYDYNLFSKEGETEYQLLKDKPFFIDTNKEKVNVVITNEVGDVFKVYSKASFLNKKLNHCVSLTLSEYPNLEYINDDFFEGVIYYDGSDYYKYIIREDEANSIYINYDKCTKTGEEKCQPFIDTLNSILKNIDVSIADIISIREYAIDNYFDKLVDKVNKEYLRTSFSIFSLKTVQDVLDNSIGNANIYELFDSSSYCIQQGSAFSADSIWVLKTKEGGIGLIFYQKDSTDIFSTSIDEGETWEFFYITDGKEIKVASLPFYKYATEEDILANASEICDLYEINNHISARNELLNKLDNFTLFEIVSVIKNTYNQ